MNIRLQTPIGRRLGAEETTKLQKMINASAERLKALGYSKPSVERRFQLDLWNIYERRSALCAYEQERARAIALKAFKDLVKPLHFVTVGHPHHRTELVCSPQSLSIDPTLRIWRKGVSALKKHGYGIRGFACFELQMCFPLNGRSFVEPHFHALVSGASMAAVKDAFKVATPVKPALRRRPTHVRGVDNIYEAISYLTKFRPTSRIQYRKSDGSYGWSHRRPCNVALDFWYQFYANRKISELLTSIGDELRVLRQPLTLELAPSPIRFTK